MKVLHLNNYGGGSGADLAFADSVAALRAHGSAENLVATADAAHPADLLFSSWKDKPGPAGFSYIYSRDNRARLGEFLTRYRPDIVHAHGFYADISPSILGAIADAKRRGKLAFIQTAHSHELVCPNASAYDYTQARICTDCRGHNPKWKIFYRNCDRRGWLYSWTKGVRCLVARQLMRQVALTDHIVCPSRLMLDSLREEGITTDKLSLVRNPVSAERPAPQSSRCEEMVYFGRFAVEKDISTLVDGFLEFRRSHPGWQLVLIGEGPEQTPLESRYGTETSVRFLPFMSRDKLFARISRARIMLMSSQLLENAPLVIPEAVLCDLWPVVPDHGGMAEMVGWLGAGSCYRYGDRRSLARVLDTATARPGTHQMLEQARGRIERELSAAAYAHRIEALYRRLVE